MWKVVALVEVAMAVVLVYVAVSVHVAAVLAEQFVRVAVPPAQVPLLTPQRLLLSIQVTLKIKAAIIKALATIVPTTYTNLLP